MNFLLDTDHLSILQRESGAEYRALVARLDQWSEDDFAASIVSFHEQTAGANVYVSKARSPAETVHGYELLELVRHHFAEMNVLPFDSVAAATFQDLRRRRIRIATMDLRIAAIAIANNLTLLTRNTVDFSRVPGLQFEDWTL